MVPTCALSVVSFLFLVAESQGFLPTKQVARDVFRFYPLEVFPLEEILATREEYAAVSAGQTYEYQGDARTDKIIGSFVEVCVTNRGFEKIRVNLPSSTPLLAAGEEFSEGTLIEFDNLKIRPYVSRANRLAYTASADAAHVVAPNKRPGMPDQKLVSFIISHTALNRHPFVMHMFFVVFSILFGIAVLCAFSIAFSFVTPVSAEELPSAVEQQRPTDTSAFDFEGAHANFDSMVSESDRICVLVFVRSVLIVPPEPADPVEPTPEYVSMLPQTGDAFSLAAASVDDSRIALSNLSTFLAKRRVFFAVASADMTKNVVYYGLFTLLPSRVLCTLVSVVVSFVVLAVWGFFVWWLLFKSGLRSKKLHPNKMLAALLADYIRDNGLCQFKSSGANASEVLVSSAIMRGEYTSDGFIVVDFFKRGDVYTEKASRQAEGLSALLSCPLDSMEDSFDRCRYRFCAVPDTRLCAVSMLTESDWSGQRDRIQLAGSLWWHFGKLPHALIAGGTGGGKSTFLYYLLGEFLRLGDATGGAADVFICDPKNAELASLSRVFSPDHVGTTPGQIAKVVRHCREVMDERYRYINDSERFRFGASAFDYGLNPVFLVFDEVAAFRAEADKKTFTEVWDNLTQLVLKARAVNVFVILALQQPRAEVVSTDIRDNLGLRVSLGDLSEEGYRMVYGSDVTGYRFNHVTEKGTGYIQLDGWNAPKSFVAPFADYSTIDYPARLAELYKAAQDRNKLSSVSDTGEGVKDAPGYITEVQEQQ
ncbi:unnamed protein product [Cylicostephanus goldi]|uniref:FtsK domain-containing protein n=1 Tax=Cylicostephanus goldi TaxID=71465 RepID=A0A3P6RHQ4_CYLGO|nr:unnamed protein product [Cylicostephanus goldi]